MQVVVAASSRRVGVEVSTRLYAGQPIKGPECPGIGRIGNIAAATRPELRAVIALRGGNELVLFNGARLPLLRSFI